MNKSAVFWFDVFSKRFGPGSSSVECFSQPLDLIRHDHLIFFLSTITLWGNWILVKNSTMEMMSTIIRCNIGSHAYYERTV